MAQKRLGNTAIKYKINYENNSWQDSREAGVVE